MSREGKLAKNTLVLGIGNVLPKATAFFTVPILTAFLSKEAYGTFELIPVLAALVLPTVSLQIHTAAFRFLIDERACDSSVQSIVTTIYGFVIPVSLLALIAAFFFLPGNTVIRLLTAIYLLSEMLLETGRQIARGLDKNKAYTVNSSLQAVLNLVLLAVLVWGARLGLLGAVLSLCISSTLALGDIMLRASLFKKLRLSAFRMDLLRKLIAYSWPMVPNCLSMWVMTVSDRFVVTAFLGVAANAVYSAANKLPSILTTVQNTFTMAWQENASIASRDHDAAEYYRRMYRTVFDFMAGVMSLLICATPILFRLLIRGDYDEAYLHMPLLFLAMFFYSLCAFLGGIYVAYKDIKSVGITTMLAALSNLVIDLAEIRSLGIYAASVSTLISYVFLFLFRVKDVQKLVKLHINLRHTVLVIVLLVVEGVLCFLREPLSDAVCCLLSVAVFISLNRPLIAAVWARCRAWLRDSTHRNP